MKKTTLFFALILLFVSQAYSSSTPSSGEHIDDMRPPERSFMAQQPIVGYHVTHHPAYEMTHLKKNQVSDKARVVITPQNADSVTRTFLDTLTEALEETGTATEDRLDTAVDSFRATLQEQKEIVGSTAKDLLKILEQKAKEVFPSESFALKLDEKIRDTKFVVDSYGNLQAVRRTPRETCCGILFSILKIFGQGTYDYLQRQADGSGVATYPQMYPYIITNPMAAPQPETYQMTVSPQTSAISRPPTPLASSLASTMAESTSSPNE